MYNNYLRNCYFHPIIWGWETLVNYIACEKKFAFFGSSLFIIIFAMSVGILFYFDFHH